MDEQGEVLNTKLSNDVVKMLDDQNVVLYERMQKLKAENVKLHKLVYTHKWSHRIMESNPAAAEYLTGCASYEIFKWLLRFAEPYLQSQGNAALADQLLLTLMKIKLNVPTVFLSSLFQYTLIEQDIEAWLSCFNEVCSKLLIWPNKKANIEGFILKIVELNNGLIVAIIFTSNGAICHVSDTLNSANKPSIDQWSFMEKLVPGNILYDITNGKSYCAIKGIKGVKLFCNTKQDPVGLTKARSTVNNSMEKLCSFSIFKKGGLKELHYANTVVKIAAVLANFHPMKNS